MYCVLRIVNLPVINFLKQILILIFFKEIQIILSIIIFTINRKLSQWNFNLSLCSLFLCISYDSLSARALRPCGLVLVITLKGQ